MYEECVGVGGGGGGVGLGRGREVGEGGRSSLVLWERQVTFWRFILK